MYKYIVVAIFQWLFLLVISFSSWWQVTVFMSKSLNHSLNHSFKNTDLATKQVFSFFFFLLGLFKKTSKYSLVKNKYTKMYLKFINFMLSILQIHLQMYVLKKIPCNCTFSILKWYT